MITICPDGSYMFRFVIRFDSGFAIRPFKDKENNCDDIASFLAMTF